ncbi:CBS domain-containing protein [Bradyrhizobium sp. BRP22]|uniref:CBS domain-containing protein n=1 Tax=Bradyrhizobium sp. BRP22 TaxID=2793821 RepID=UPI001CD42A6C|nr:CBS domain-containing protein [Bradyrhizobium sp. BRP22]MCA1458893.1 CBS domain-containing protein [Bradyrhizobium sp. BRP22]
MRVHEIMSHNVIKTSIDTPVVDAARIMLAHHISGLPVVRRVGQAGRYPFRGDFIRPMELGTEKAPRRWLAFLAGPDQTAVDFARQHGRRVGQIITPNPITIAEDAPLEQVARLMEEHHIKRLPVVRGATIVGMVARACRQAETPLIALSRIPEPALIARGFSRMRRRRLAPPRRW